MSLLKQLSEQTATLVRQELELAKAEMQQKGKRAGVGIGLIGGGGVLGAGRGRRAHGDADPAAGGVDGRRGSRR